MEFFLDDKMAKTIKPFGIAALGIAAIFSKIMINYSAIAYAFNKFKGD